MRLATIKTAIARAKDPNAQILIALYALISIALLWYLLRPKKHTHRALIIAGSTLGAAAHVFIPPL